MPNTDIPCEENVLSDCEDSSVKTELEPGVKRLELVNVVEDKTLDGSM